MSDRVTLAGLAFLLGACANAPKPAGPTTAAPTTVEPDHEVAATPVPTASTPPPELKTLQHRSTDPVAVVFVIDRSGSMSGEPMQRAKDATLGGVSELGDTDWVAVIGFDSQPTTVVSAQPVSRAGVAAALATMTPGGGTEIFSAIHLAYETLQSVDLTHKQVIVLTDGQAPRAGVRDLVTAMRNEGIVVSAVGLGDGYDPLLLGMIATVGGGRFHEVADVSHLEEVLRDEVAAFVQSTAK